MRVGGRGEQYTNIPSGSRKFEGRGIVGRLPSFQQVSCKENKANQGEAESENNKIIYQVPDIISLCSHHAGLRSEESETKEQPMFEVIRSSTQKQQSK